MVRTKGFKFVNTHFLSQVHYMILKLNNSYQQHTGPLGLLYVIPTK